MSCNSCKETKYNILLNPDTSNQTEAYRSELKNSLAIAMDITDIQSEGLVSIAFMNGSSVIASRVPRDEVSTISVKLAENRIPHQVKLSNKH